MRYKRFNTVSVVLHLFLYSLSFSLSIFPAVPLQLSSSRTVVSDRFRSKGLEAKASYILHSLRNSAVFVSVWFEVEKICMPVLEIELLAGFFVSCSLGCIAQIRFKMRKELPTLLTKDCDISKGKRRTLLISAQTAQSKVVRSELSSSICTEYNRHTCCTSTSALLISLSR
ncbi:unnamed protein product [Citrullus colocynthis]|uniref:Secreted protein n=1 Tax=Citrullus colocynthis TaxID=252529 RepID=A0ABP0YR07_9ROSI